MTFDSTPHDSFRVSVPAALRSAADGRRAIRLQGVRTVGEVLAELESRFPRITRLLRRSDGALRPTMKVYVNDEDIRFLEGEATRLTESCEITIVRSVREVAPAQPARKEVNNR